MSGTVLAIVELDNYPEQVVDRARWLAALYDHDIELLLCDPTAGYLKDSFLVSSELKNLADEVHTAQDNLLEELARSARQDGAAVKASVSHARPVADTIVARAADLGPRFVVKGTRYHSSAERATFAAGDWQLIRELNVPLWFVKPRAWKEKPLVVAAVDPVNHNDQPANLDQKIVDAARSVSSRCGGRLELLHTSQRLEELGARAMKTFKPLKLPIDEIDAKIRNEHRKALEAFAKKVEVPEDAVHQLPGRVEEILPAYAHSNGASLVVMGARARSGLKRRIIGNSAERALDHLPCDVLIIFQDA